MADLNNLQQELDDTQHEQLFDDNDVPPPQEEPAEEEEEELNEQQQEHDRHHGPAPPIPTALQAAAAVVVDKDWDNMGDGTAGGALLDENYVKLVSSWIKETQCPELLPREEELFDAHQAALQERQDNVIEKLLEEASLNKQASLKAQIYKMEAERVKYMTEDYASQRLDKIEQHALFCRTLVDRMSHDEVDYLKSYGELMESHLNRTVLNHMPKDAWKKLDDAEMISSPNMNTFLFCRVLAEGGVEIASGDDEFSIQEFKQGSCLIARYNAVQKLLQEGKIELLM